MDTFGEETTAQFDQGYKMGMYTVLGEHTCGSNLFCLEGSQEASAECLD